jgi:hypothetical protein
MLPDAATSRMEQLQREVSAAAKIAERRDRGVDSSGSASSSRKYSSTSQESQTEARIGSALQKANADATLRLAQERAFWNRVQESAKAAGASALPSQCVLTADSSMTGHQQARLGGASGQQAAGSYPETCVQQNLVRAAAAAARQRQTGDGGAQALSDVLGSAASRRHAHQYMAQRQAEDASDASLAALQAEAYMCSALMAAGLRGNNNAMSSAGKVDGLAPSMEQRLAGGAVTGASVRDLGGAVSPADAFASADSDGMLGAAGGRSSPAAGTDDVHCELMRLSDEEFMAAEPPSRAESPSNDWWLQPGSEPGQSLLDASGTELDDWFFEHMHEGGFGSLASGNGAE